MSELKETEFLELSARARDLDRQVTALTRQVQDWSEKHRDALARLIEQTKVAEKAMEELEAFKRMSKAAIQDIDDRLGIERSGRAKDAQKAIASGIQARADLIAERDDLLVRKKALEDQVAFLTESLDQAHHDHDSTISALKAAITEAQRVLPCGHHHSLDTHDGNCKLCIAQQRK